MKTDETLSLSKSKYCGICQCPKTAWLAKHCPSERKFDAQALKRMDAGNVIGDLAMGLFGDYMEVTAFDEDGKIDLDKMIENTKNAMDAGHEVICEASFSGDSGYCAVDILRKKDGGWAIYEVKSSTSSEKEIYWDDVAYQKHVVTQCGHAVTGTYLVHLNTSYVHEGDLDLDGLFAIDDISEHVEEASTRIAATIAEAERMYAMEEEPPVPVSAACNKPYICPFWDHCHRDIPSGSVFELYKTNYSKKLELWNSGKKMLSDVEGCFAGDNLTDRIRRMQVEHYMHDLPAFVDKENLSGFLSQIPDTVYYLDFETVQVTVPMYDGSHPYEQLPFQYSCHISHPDGTLEHTEFLGHPEQDPRRTLAEQLCHDIPKGSCVLVYNKGFECARLKELAKMFPDLSEHLLDIRENIVDLKVPFASGWCYNRAMGNSFSIKSVLPALFPDDPELDYHNLDGIHNGGEAMTAFFDMLDMDAGELSQLRSNLLHYCELDTYALVKVLAKLRELAA